MRVTFRRFPDHSSGYSVIERDDGVVYQLRGFTRSGAELPHDLRHLVSERELGITDGFWGGIAAGLVYPGMEPASGPRPASPVQPPDAVSGAQRERIMRAELLANLVEAVAVLREPSAGQIERLARTKLPGAPAAGPGADPAAVTVLPPPAALAAAARALQVEAARWARLRPGEELGYEWRPAPPAAGWSPGRALHAVPRPRPPGDPRDPRRPGRGGAR